MEKFTSKDIQQIKNHGLSLKKIHQNLKTFEEGIPFVELVGPATLENGIWKLSDKELKFYGEKYENENVEVVKFVPASGAATRMFKFLQVFLQSFAEGNLAGLKSKGEKFEKLMRKPEHTSVREFFDRLPDFAFYEKLLFETKKQYSNFDDFSEDEKKYTLLKTLLDEDKLNFSNLPKGLVPFHKYSDEIRTAFEEHFVEAAAYSAKDNFGKLHFTVAENHLEKFQKEWKDLQKKTKSKAGTEFEVSYSFQEKSTDTIAVDMENKPFRDATSALCFRPAGHGALLENLNQINADIIFIKNIDNVSTENNLPIISTYKKVLAGILLELQQKTFEFLSELEKSGNLESLEKHAKTFLKEKLNVPREPETLSELETLLNRPIRVCGMVKNTGAPGGGPFWINDENEKISLQIVETAQIDLNDPQQKKCLESATHFNPVDLVCGVKNYKREKFDLLKFSNPNRGFITEKSADGRDLKALELPGLWNGAMEHWNTIFVEVPLETFNPVKTVMDLLKPGHR